MCVAMTKYMISIFNEEGEGGGELYVEVICKVKTIKLLLRIIGR